MIRRSGAKYRRKTSRSPVRIVEIKFNTHVRPAPSKIIQTRICRRCNNFFKFKATERQKKSRICGRCRLDYHKVLA